MANFAEGRAPQNCKVIDFEQAEVFPGFMPDTWFLRVQGKKPCLNMDVSLVPLVYVKCPDFWGIEVVGCLKGNCIPTVGTFDETIPLTGITGYEGIEVIGASASKKFKVSGGCSQGKGFGA
jgi:hypothetical protein